MEIEIKDNDFLAIFDIEIRKFMSQNNCEKVTAFVSYRIMSILETSPNLIITKEKNNIKYFYRNSVEVILDRTLNNKNEEYILEKGDK